MKKISFLLVMFITTISISAQESNESNKNDSLQYQLEKLQHDYDYLDCEYQLNKLKLELEICKNEIRINVNFLSINFYHGGYDDKFYQINKKNYEEIKDYLDKKEQFIYMTKIDVKRKMESAGFNDLEINVLESGLNIMDSGLSSAKLALEYYKEFLDIYRDSR